jgi:hypothetical protein
MGYAKKVSLFLEMKKYILTGLYCLSIIFVSLPSYSCEPFSDKKNLMPRNNYQNKAIKELDVLLQDIKNENNLEKRYLRFIGLYHFIQNQNIFMSSIESPYFTSNQLYWSAFSVSLERLINEGSLKKIQNKKSEIEHEISMGWLCDRDEIDVCDIQVQCAFEILHLLTENQLYK